MQRPLNISAALAIAIERQVEDIIANAKAQCALQYRAAPRRDLPDATLLSSADFAPWADFLDLRADSRGEHDDALRPRSDFPRSDVSIAEPSSGQRLDIWKRLRSLFRPRRRDA